MGKGQTFQQIILEQLEIHMGRNEIQSLPHITHKNYPKWLTKLNVKITELLEENIGEKSLRLWGRQILICFGQ